MLYGNYDLCVVANGISSHCIDFCHRPQKRCCCPEPTATSCGYERCAEEACGCGHREVDPVISELKAEV